MRRDPVAADTFGAVRRHLTPAAALTGKVIGQGAVEESAAGCRVRTSDGRSLLDFGSYGVALLGHRNPAVLAAVIRQLDQLPVSTRTLANPVTAAAATRLGTYLGAGLTRVYLGANGSDAVEAALKLARLATGRPTVLAVRGGYHGKTLGALSATSTPLFREGLHALLGHVEHLDVADTAALRVRLRAEDVAAVIFEPIQGEGGVVPLDRDALAEWCDAAHDAGAFAISDEIQCGLRRCLAPSVAVADELPVDAVLFGKGLGGGVVPVSAVVCTDDLYRPLLADPYKHTATFSAYPLGCAALVAALDEVERLAGHAGDLAERLAGHLADLRGRHPDAVSQVRGRGLLWAIEFATPHLGGEVLVNLAQEGLLVSPCLGRPECLRLMPPLVAGLDDIDTAHHLISAALDRAVRDVEN
ncbi:aspartate aminotransferase family protein [Micromonospora sp. AKA38]|uniref:aspartate aminotransferase family protein n=1 Tax=Micromonospora sp. AKA38 TaxID=2733861 RepID=UPI0022BEF60B|nr:aspartate aminotransferase family protein [Micromonospora sp. AKA38]GHJ16145.1 acetylornithine/acetyl-lysine aminotransferase [Micromonospora sp. AKA38]